MIADVRNREQMLAGHRLPGVRCCNVSAGNESLKSISIMANTPES
jgi:hypothetical protein